MSDIPNEEECELCFGCGEITTLDRETVGCPQCIATEHRAILQAKDREIAELEQTIRDYKEANEDKKRLTREIDVIINGDGAAQQASLCDVVGDIKALVSVEAKLKSRVATLEKQLEGKIHDC